MGSGGEDETFLETANRELAETSRVQSEAIARLEEDAARALECSDLAAKLHTTEHQAELNTALLTAEKKARVNAQIVKSSFLAAIHGEKEQGKNERLLVAFPCFLFSLPSSFFFLLSSFLTSFPSPFLPFP